MKSHVIAALSVSLLMAVAPSRAGELKPATIQAWEEYIRGANARMMERVRGSHFLWTDESGDRLNRVRRGEVVVAAASDRAPVNVPHGLIHDWIGAAFIPDAHITDVLAVVRDYNRYKDYYRPSVVDSKRLSAPGSKDDAFSMVLLNQSLLMKKALASEYESSYTRVDDRHWYSVSRSTSIREIENFEHSNQRTLPPDTGTGLIWRLYSFSRFVERDGGVYVEFEAIALSRDIPFSVRLIVEPIVRRVSKTSLLMSLKQTSDALRPRREASTESASAPRNGAFSKSLLGR